MKYVIIFLLFTSIVGTCFGFYLKPSNPAQGDLIIGLSIVLGFLIVMPLFIYYRWKDRSVKDYMLTKESIEKMKAFKNSKKKQDIDER